MIIGQVKQGVITYGKIVSKLRPVVAEPAIWEDEDSKIMQRIIERNHKANR